MDIAKIISADQVFHVANVCACVHACICVCVWYILILVWGVHMCVLVCMGAEVDAIST